MRPAPLPLLETLVGRVRTRARRLIAFAVVGAALAAAAFFAAPPRYVSTSSVALSPHLTYVSQGTEDTKPAFASLDTVAALVDSDEVTAAVAASLHVDVAQASRSVTVTAQPLSTVLRLHVEGPTKQLARAGSRAAATALLREQNRLFHLSPDRVRLVRKRVGNLRIAVAQRTYAGLDVTRTNKVLGVLSQTLANAVATNRPNSLLLPDTGVRKVRIGQLPVYVTGGLAAGAALAWVLPGTRRLSPRRRRRPTAAMGGTLREGAVR